MAMSSDKAMALYKVATASAGLTSSAAQFEMEDATPRKDDSGCRSWIFPMRPFKFCPNILCIYFPDTLKEIQDCTHFSLVLGMLALIAMFIQSILVLVMKWTTLLTQPLQIVRTGLTLLLVITVTPYCWQIIQQYDQRLTDKQAEARKAKEELSKKYQDLCSEMHDTLDKFAEYTGAYAQNIFEGKYRSFGHWAKQVASALEAESKDLTDREKEELKEEFRKMCMNWFRVLAECGINPAEKPIILCKKEELDKLDSFTEIAKCCQERCIPPKITMETHNQPKNDLWKAHMKGRCTKCDTLYSVQQAASMRGRCQTCTKSVVGLTYWLEEVPVWNSKRPGTCPSCKEWFSPDQAYQCDAQCPRCNCELQELKPVTQELQQQQQALKKDASHAKQQAKRFSGGDAASLAAFGLGSTTGSRIIQLAAAKNQRRTACCPSWLFCDASCHCSKVAAPNAHDGFPTTYQCCCMNLRVFSRDHIKLMLGFLICLTLIGANVAWTAMGGEHVEFIIRLVENGFVQLSLLVLLIRFEDLDIVQQLEKETQEMREEKDRVENTNKNVQETFGMLQKMNVVWLNRTIPRLDLMNEISNKLCDVDQNTSKGEWIKANKAIETLEKKIGCIQDWVSEDKLKEADKKNFEKIIKHVYQEGTITDMTRALDRVNNDQLTFLKALAPPAPDKPMVNIEILKGAQAHDSGGPRVVTTHRASEVPMLEV